MKQNLVSIVIPLYNEQEVLPKLWEALESAISSPSPVVFEVVFVDDGSTDATWTELSKLVDAHPEVRSLRLSRNFGQQSAYLAGLDACKGDAAICMDGDLQDDPAILSRLVDCYLEGFDVVNVRRAQRDSPYWLRCCYFLYYRLLKWSSSYELPADIGDFSLVSRRVLEQILACREQRPYLRGLRSWVGFRQTQIVADRPQRAAGKSKYSLPRLLGLASDALFSFSLLPIRVMLLLGALAMSTSVLFGLYSVIWKLLVGHSPSGFTALLVVIVFIGGVNFFIVGLLGEYVGRILEEVRGRPRFIVSESRPPR